MEDKLTGAATEQKVRILKIRKAAAAAAEAIARLRWLACLACLDLVRTLCWSEIRGDV